MRGQLAWLPKPGRKPTGFHRLLGECPWRATGSYAEVRKCCQSMLLACIEPGLCFRLVVSGHAQCHCGISRPPMHGTHSPLVIVVGVADSLVISLRACSTTTVAPLALSADGRAVPAPVAGRCVG